MKTKYIIAAAFLLIAFNATAQHMVSVTTPKGQTFTISGDSTKYNFKATVANYEGRFEDAAGYKIRAVELGESTDKAASYYDAACYFSLAENMADGFKYLKLSLEAGYDDVAHTLYDNDLEFLRNNKGWGRHINKHLKRFFKSNSQELAKMYGEDQAARMTGEPINWEELNRLDEERRVRVLELLERGKVKSAYDYYWAAMIMHHGAEASDFEKAHELVVKSLTLESPHRMAPWLAGASKDRYLLKIGEPQWFGTQGMQFKKGKMTMDPAKIDTTAVTPEQRKAWNAPKLATIRTYIKNFLEVAEAEKKGDK